MSALVNETHDDPWFERPSVSPYVAKILHMNDEREVDCKICTRPFPIKPQSLSCGHTFCRACIEGFLIHDETLPRGRNSSDVICPTCAKGSIVQWVIDGDESACKKDDFNLEAVRYDAHRRRTIQKYKSLYRTQVRYWKEIVKQEVDETFYEDEYSEDTGYSDKTGHLEEEDDDVRGIHHVSGRYINCIIESPSALPSIVETLNVEFCDENEDSERRCDNVKSSNGDFIQPKASLTDVDPTSRNAIRLTSEQNCPINENVKRKHNTEYHRNNPSNQEESTVIAESWSSVDYNKGPQDIPRIGSCEVHIPDICSGGEQKTTTPGKVLWDVGNGDSRNLKNEDEDSLDDQNERCSLGEWSAHLALIGFIVGLSLVAFVASILGK